MKDKTSGWVSVSVAVREKPISRPRLLQAIERGEIEALFTGTRTIKVRLDDVEKLLTTPPLKPQGTALTPQQAA